MGVRDPGEEPIAASPRARRPRTSTNIDHDHAYTRRRGTAPAARRPGRGRQGGRGGRGGRGSQVWLRAPAWAVQLAVLAPIALAYLWMAVLASRGLSGDEPHYLAITQGLWLYHTLDQTPVLVVHHDFFAYYHSLMSSHSLHRDGRLYPLHPLGLPILLLPGFALAGAVGARATVALLAVLLCWRTLRLATRLVGPVPAALAVLGLGLSAPFVLNAGAIYPDVASGLALALAYEAIDAARLTVRRALALGLLLAAMPWLHVKLLVVVAAYMAWAAYALLYGRPRDGARASARRTVLLAALALDPPVLSVAALIAFNGVVYGSPGLTAQFALRGQALLTGNPLGGMVGQLFAQGQGALGTAPLLLLAIPGAGALWRRDRATALKVGLVTLPFWIVTLTYRDWWGGDCPPLRYLVPMLPLWTLGIAALLDGLRARASRLAVGLAGAASLLLALAMPGAPLYGWTLPDGQGGLLVGLGRGIGLPLSAWFPLFEPTKTGPGLWRHAWLIPLWTAVFVALWLFVAWRERLARSSSRSRKSG